MTLEQAIEVLARAVQAAFRELIKLIRLLVFADPLRPDWGAWPTGQWVQLLEVEAVPALERVVAAVLRDVGLAGEQLKLLATSVVAEVASTFIATSTLDDEMFNDLTQAYTAGETTDSKAQVTKLLGTFDEWDNRAKFLAENAAALAYNTGVDSAASAFALAGVPIQKQWNTRGDDKVRPSHKKVNGDRVNAGEYFTVGGVLMRFPHDPFAPGVEVFNCRCRLSLVGVGHD